MPKKTTKNPTLELPKFIISEKDVGERLDKFLQVKLKDYSRTDVQKLITDGHVLVAGSPAKKNLRLTEGMHIALEALPQKEASELKPEKMKLNIVYEDDDVAVIFKPRGVVVHPGAGALSGTLAAGLLYHFKDNLSTVNGPLRPGIVHRLDKDTPGLMVVAKNDKAHRSLAKQLETRTLHRKYEALIWGHPRDLSGEIELPVGRDPKSRIRMAVVRDGKYAKTRYKAKEFFAIATLMEYELDTGRTHQIRVHSRYTGHPIVGDPIYEGREPSLHRIPPLYHDTAEELLKIAPAQLLQAVEIMFVHPRTRKKMTFSVPLEKPFEKAVKFLEKECLQKAPTFDEDSSFRDFDESEINHPYLEEEPIEEEEYDYEEEPVKERLTRAERLAMKKERIKKRKAIEAEKREKKAKREAEKRGEVYVKKASDAVTGYEPTIDPSYLE